MVSRRALLASSVIPMLHSQEPKAAMFQNAEAYERFMGRWSRHVAQLLLDFAPVPDSGQALDLGCGAGSLAFAIAGKTKATTVIGIDLSAEYVAYAVNRNSAPDRVSFQVGDAQQLPFADSTFRATLSLLVFNFIPDPRKALRRPVA